MRTSCCRRCATNSAATSKRSRRAAIEKARAGISRGTRFSFSSYSSALRFTFIEVPQIVAVVGMFALSIMTWSSAPSRIAVHWGTSGHPDRYSGKVEGLLLVPIVAAIVYGGGYLFQGLLAAKPKLALPFVLFRCSYLISLVAAYAVIMMSICGLTVPLGAVVLPILFLNAFAFGNFIWRAVSASHS